jgi:branched-chain amino acid transport system substrate-binding protein
MKIAGVVLSIVLLSVINPRLEAAEREVAIGVLEDEAGQNADATGIGSRLAAEMAIEDAGLEMRGWKVRLVDADHQNRADVAVGIVHRWFDTDHIDVVAGLGNSSVALAVNTLVKEYNKVALVSGGGTSDLTGTACTANTVQWTYDTFALANSTGSVVTEGGGKTWFFITADYAFGKALERDSAIAIERAGGQILGEARAPLNSSDFSSYLLEAQSSGAKVIGFAIGGGDATNAIKQAAEFGLMKSDRKAAALSLFLTDVHALGLEIGQGLSLTETFYWDLNEKTREFARRFSKRIKSGAPPSMPQAGVYASLLHYFKAIENMAEDVHDGAKVVASMKAIRTDDPLFGEGVIRIDGRAIHPAYLFQVKSPSESRGPWDLYKLVKTIPGNQAFRPLKDGGCPLVK